jgi:hypothetical protein
MIRSAVEGDAAGTLHHALVCLAVGAVTGVVAIHRLGNGWGRSNLV